MPQVGIRELKNQATEILRSVREEKVEFVVTYRGEPVAVLMPITRHGRVYDREYGDDNLDPEITNLVKLRPQNRALLQLYREWMNDIQPEDDAIMQQLENILESNPIRFRTPEELEL